MWDITILETIMAKYIPKYCIIHLDDFVSKQNDYNKAIEIADISASHMLTVLLEGLETFYLENTTADRILEEIHEDLGALLDSLELNDTWAYELIYTETMNIFNILVKNYADSILFDRRRRLVYRPHRLQANTLILKYRETNYDPNSAS